MDRLIDLQDKEYQEVKKILSRFVFGRQVWVFGSRVKWNTNKYSDLDLVIFEASTTEIENLKEAFEESNLTFSVQVLSWENIPEDFKDNIKQKYVVLQQAKKDLKIFFETNFKETEIGKVPSDWEVREIGEIFNLYQGIQIASKLRRQKIEKNYIPLLKITDLPKKIFNEFVNLNDIRKSHIANKENLIYTRTGQVGLIYTDVEGCVHNNCFKINFDNSKFDKKYIFLFLGQKWVFDYSNSVATGSVQKDLTHPAFKSLNFSFPLSLTEQKAIAKILSDLDEKIEVNKKQNEILENIGKTIFKRWFVDFEFPQDMMNDDFVETDELHQSAVEIGHAVETRHALSLHGNDNKYENEKNNKNLNQQNGYKSNGGKMVYNEKLEKEIPAGWEVGKLGDMVFEISDKINNEKNIFVLSAINKGELIKSEDYFKKQVFSKKINKYKKIKKYDFAYNPARINIGSIGMLKDFDFGAISPVYVGFSVRKNYHWFFEKKLKSKNMKKQIQSLCSGGVRQVLDFKGFSNLDFLIPNEELILKFNITYEKKLKMIKNNELENQKLIQLRDYLLPKLMKGEIRVKTNET